MSSHSTHFPQRLYSPPWVLRKVGLPSETKITYFVAPLRTEMPAASCRASSQLVPPLAEYPFTLFLKVESLVVLFRSVLATLEKETRERVTSAEETSVVVLFFNSCSARLFTADFAVLNLLPSMEPDLSNTTMTSALFEEDSLEVLPVTLRVSL